MFFQLGLRALLFKASFASSFFMIDSAFIFGNLGYSQSWITNAIPFFDDSFEFSLSIILLIICFIFYYFKSKYYKNNNLLSDSSQIWSSEDQVFYAKPIFLRANWILDFIEFFLLIWQKYSFYNMYTNNILEHH